LRVLLTFNRLKRFTEDEEVLAHVIRTDPAMQVVH
jgi:hypothetical protein